MEWKPPSCETVRVILSQWLDEAASEDELILAQAHLIDCPDCRAFRVSIKLLDSQLHTARLNAPPDFASRVLARIEAAGVAPAQPARPKRTKTVLALAFALALAALSSGGLALVVNTWPVFSYPTLAAHVANMGAVMGSTARAVANALRLALAALDSQAGWDLAAYSAGLAAVALALWVLAVGRWYRPSLPGPQDGV